MVSKKIDNAMIKRIIERLKYYDLHRKFPEDRVRIDITLPFEKIRQLKQEKDRTKKSVSKLIENSLFFK